MNYPGCVRFVAILTPEPACTGREMGGLMAPIARGAFAKTQRILF